MRTEARKKKQLCAPMSGLQRLIVHMLLLLQPVSDFPGEPSAPDYISYHICHAGRNKQQCHNQQQCQSSRESLPPPECSASAATSIERRCGKEREKKLARAVRRPVGFPKACLLHVRACFFLQSHCVCRRFPLQPRFVVSPAWQKDTHGGGEAVRNARRTPLPIRRAQRQTKKKKTATTQHGSAFTYQVDCRGAR